MKSFLICLAGALLVSTGASHANDSITYDPPVHKQGIGCATADDVHKFVDFIKAVPGNTPTQLALLLAQSKGIQCGAGQADIIKEEIVDHFVWIDGSKMLLIHYTFQNGHDVFTWREDKLAEPSACVGRCV